MSGFTTNPRSDTSSTTSSGSAAGGRPPPTSIPAYVQPPVPRYTNPLLSAAVTNLTLDDFTHNAVLLPAALPVVVPTPVPSAPAAPAAAPPLVADGFLNQLPPNPTDSFQHAAESHQQRPPNDSWSLNSDIPAVYQSTQSVNEFAIIDSTTLNQPTDVDHFSEISLDQTQETFPDHQTYEKPVQPNTSPFSLILPGQSATLNALAALPNVASVFSSFSNIITGIAQETVAPRTQTPHQAPSATTYDQQPPLTSAATPSAHQFSPFPHQPPAVAEPAGPPPRLYSPHDHPAVLSDSSAKPPTLGGAGSGNTYRLQAKRKVYAPLPGLNSAGSGVAEVQPIFQASPQSSFGNFPPHFTAQPNQAVPEVFAPAAVTLGSQIPFTPPTAPSTSFQPFVGSLNQSTPPAVVAESETLLTTGPPSIPVSQIPGVPISTFTPHDLTSHTTPTYQPAAAAVSPVNAQLPPTGNSFSYRLKGKPQYRAPNTYQTVAAKSLPGPLGVDTFAHNQPPVNVPPAGGQPQFFQPIPLDNHPVTVPLTPFAPPQATISSFSQSGSSVGPANNYSPVPLFSSAADQQRSVNAVPPAIPLLGHPQTIEAVAEIPKVSIFSPFPLDISQPKNPVSVPYLPETKVNQAYPSVPLFPSSGNQLPVNVNTFEAETPAFTPFPLDSQQQNPATSTFTLFSNPSAVSAELAHPTVAISSVPLFPLNPQEPELSVNAPIAAPFSTFSNQVFNENNQVDWQIDPIQHQLTSGCSVAETVPPITPTAQPTFESLPIVRETEQNNSQPPVTEIFAVSDAQTELSAAFSFTGNAPSALIPSQAVETESNAELNPQTATNSLFALSNAQPESVFEINPVEAEPPKVPTPIQFLQTEISDDPFQQSRSNTPAVSLFAFSDTQSDATGTGFNFSAPIIPPTEQTAQTVAPQVFATPNTNISSDFQPFASSQTRSDVCFAPLYQNPPEPTDFNRISPQIVELSRAASPPTQNFANNFFQPDSQHLSNINRPSFPQTSTTFQPEATQQANTNLSSFFGGNSSISAASWFNPSPTIPVSLNQAPLVEPIPHALPIVAPSSTEFTTNTQIQNFFNNPPLLLGTQLDLVKDLNSQSDHLHRSEFTKRNSSVDKSEAASDSILSNLVEPPSSVSEFSEFSELANQQAQGSSAKDAEDPIADIFGSQSSNATPPVINFFNSLTTNDEPDAAYPEDTSITDAMAVKTQFSSVGNIAYRPVYKHWFYNDIGTGAASETSTAPSSKTVVPTKWTPFTMADSMRLQESVDAGHATCTTNGGRFDVKVGERRRLPVYWTAAGDEVRCCSWFFKGTDSRLVPYEESVADRLEAEYKEAAELGVWNRKLELENGETIVFHAPNVMVHFTKSQSPDSWTENSPISNRPRVVKRGIDEFNIEDGESEQVDHLMFMVHGIGSACDLKFRSVEQVVEEFRSTAHQLVQSHYRSSIDQGRVGRIEVLPISWHSELHSEESGIDEKLRSITLESIPKLRTFTNSTLLDILFYTSPVFCQQIIDAVANSINRKYNLYRERNPSFVGDVSLAGHSLGSVILFDLLQHQVGVEIKPTMSFAADNSLPHNPAAATENFTVGQAGTGQPFIRYPKLDFQPKKFFAFGSPIGMFVLVRGITALGLDYKLPTCDNFYNIFHPYDPVAFRIEALISPSLANLRPVLIPHHKGRKRMHLELRETIQRVGNDIKQRLVDTFKSTMNKVYNMSPIGGSSTPKSADQDIQSEVEEVLKMQAAELEAATTIDSESRERTLSISTTSSTDLDGLDEKLGRLNGGRRIDYVLQEAPLEFFNEYLFALTSHVCYWESADTTLFIAKEIYSSMGICTDSQVPQQTLIIERPVTPQQPH